MQRIAGMTVKAQGDCEAWYNGQRDALVEAVKAEMLRQRDALNAEMDDMRQQMDKEISVERDRAQMQYKARCRLLDERLDMMRRSLTARKSPARRAARAIEDAWAMAWALGKCLPEIGERLGLWRYEGDDRPKI